MAKDLPVDAYWLCGGHSFEMHVAWSKQQVTLLIFSPHLAKHDDPENPEFTDKESIWVVKRVQKDAPHKTNRLLKKDIRLVNEVVAKTVGERGIEETSIVARQPKTRPFDA